MKTIKFLMCLLVIFTLITSCQPSPSSLLKEKESAFKNGFESASSILSLEKFFDPRTYAHTHTGPIQKETGSSSIKYGTLVVVDKTIPDDPIHGHSPLFYLPFINSKNVPEDSLKMMMIDAPANTLDLDYQVAVIEVPSTTGPSLKIKIAYDLTIK